jgi:hypothetical protein
MVDEYGALRANDT